jgi:hypothetical protein
MQVSDLLTTRLLYLQGNSAPYPLDRRLDGPQSPSGRRGVQKNPLPLPKIGAHGNVY